LAKTRLNESPPTPTGSSDVRAKLRQVAKDVTGQKPQVVAFGAETPTTWLLLPEGLPVGLLIQWQVDVNRYGQYHLTLIGCEDGAVPQKPLLRHGALLPAFFGDVSVRGSGRNDLFASYGYEDPDQVNEDGVVINKPQTVVLSPLRKD
jgi:hypothetical protein